MIEAQVAGVMMHGHKWGDSYRLYGSENEWVCVARAGKSSVHYHSRYENTIIVLSGKLQIRFMDRGQTSGRTVLLIEGQMITIPVGVVHEHTVIVKGVFLERYESSGECDIDPLMDITRLTESNMMKHCTTNTPEAV